MIKKNLAIKLFLCLFIFSIIVAGFNFGGSSPDTGEADDGANVGVFVNTVGTFSDTRTDDTIYFAMERDANTAGAANQTLGFNLSFFTQNSSIRILAINGSTRYCHARRSTNICDGTGAGQTPQGTPGLMNILVRNASSNVFRIIRNLTATTTNAENILVWNTSDFTNNISQLINSSGFLTVSFEFSYTGGGRSAFLNDHTNITVSYDRAPITSLYSPANNSIIVIRNITFSCNATDDFGLKNLTLLTNIGGAFHANKSNSVGGVANNTNFSLINVSDGEYIWTCQANDTSNLSSFAPSNFTITFYSINFTSNNCLPSQINPGENTICNATASSITSNIDVVRANITLPNSTVINATITNTSGNFSFSFNQTGTLGIHNVTWFANDTDGHSRSVTASFNVGDTVPPAISLITINNLNSSNYTIGLSFNASDMFNAVFSCSISIDNLLNQTNTSIQNNTQSVFSVSGFNISAIHNWSITCADNSSNSNTIGVNNFTIDKEPVMFNILNNSPSSQDDLDPGVLINFTANVTDNRTAVGNVILQYKLSTDAFFTNLTMSFDRQDIYIASFVASTAGNYTVRLFATDIVGNEGTSNSENLTVEFDRTWTITPATLTPFLSNLSANVTLGNITINNTGDFALNFTVSSDFANTRFNISFPKELAAKEKAGIEINVTSPSTNGATIITLTTTAESNAQPASRTTQGTLIIAPNQPVLLSTITSIASAVMVGTTDFTIVSKLENIGQGNATNVSFFVILPSDWNLVSGTLNSSIGNLSSGDVVAKTIIASIPSDAAGGNKTVIANSSGFNDTFGEIAPLGLILGDAEIVDVRIQELLGGGGAAAGAGGGGGGGGSAGGSGSAPSFATPRPPKLIKTLTTQEFIETKETINLVRGEAQSFPLKITNVFENSKLFNIKLEISGYLAQYLSSSPLILDDIEYTKSKSFIIDVASPAYREQAKYELIFTITGDAIAKDFVEDKGKKVEINSIKHFTEKRVVTLNIHEVSPALAKEAKFESEKFVNELINAKLPVKTANYLLEQIHKAYELDDFGEVDKLNAELENVRNKALEAKSLLDSLNQKVSLATKRGIDSSETKRMLVLAKSALEREDYDMALQRLREAQVIELVETKGAFNLIIFLKRFWWVLAIAGSIVAFAGIVSYRKIMLSIIAKRISDLSIEEIAIIGLMRDLQIACFKEKNISIAQYHKRMYQYENRMEKIKVIISKLRTKRVLLSTLEEELAQLKNEDDKILKLMKDTQELYFIKHSLNRSKYLRRMEEYRLRAAELEENIAIIEARIAKKNARNKKIKESLKSAGNAKNITTNFKKIVEKIRLVKEKAQNKSHAQDANAIAQLLEKESASKNTQELQDDLPIIQNKIKAAKASSKSTPNRHELISMLKQAHSNSSSFFSFEPSQRMQNKTTPAQTLQFEILPQKVKAIVEKKQIIENLKRAFDGKRA